MPSYPIPSCPTTITPPNANGFSLEPKKSVDGMRTEMGSTRMRRFNTPNVYVVNAEFSFFTQAKFVEFLTWLKYETNYGNLWFKADWFDALGFTAGEYVFKFVELPFSNTGYLQTHNATLLMAPYNDNVVSGDYTELGMGGEFIDEDFPFGFEQFECEDLTYYRTFFFTSVSYLLYCVDWNESNWTAIGTPFSFAATVETRNVRDIAAMKADHIAVVNGNAGCKLGMYKFDGTNFTLLGTETAPTPNYSTLVTKMTRLSDSRVAIYDGFSTDKKLVTWEFNYGTNVWAQVGSKYDLSALHNGGIASNNNDITCMGNNRIAFVIVEAAGTVDPRIKLYAFDFNGSTWSIVGTPLSVYGAVDASGHFSISALSETEIVLTTNTGAPYPTTYQNRLTKFTFNGSTWSAGTPSVQFTNGGTPKLAVFAIDKVGIHRANLSGNMEIITNEFVDPTFEEEGNGLAIGDPSNYTQHITAYYLPEDA